MVYELKEPCDGSKGVLVFTHKEKSYLDPKKPVLAHQLHELKRQYVLGMHWGHVYENVDEVPFIDFHLAGPNTVTFDEDADVRRVPMCSRNFIPPYFRRLDIPTRWDILTISRPVNIKRLDELLDVIRMVYNDNVDMDVLLLCPMNSKAGGPHRDESFFETYRTAFSEAERKNITLVTPVAADDQTYPLPNSFLPYLYNASTAFTLFSQKEGESRVIHEALLCGTPVVVRSDLLGGGRDYLDDRNSRTFSTLVEAKDIFRDVASNPECYEFDPSYLHPELSSSFTAEQLETEIAGVFNDLGIEYRGEIEKDGLAFKLPSHDLTLPRNLRQRTTNDLKSRRALSIYIDMKLDKDRSTTTGLMRDLRLGSVRLRELDTKGAVATRLARIDQSIPLPVYETARRLNDRLSS